MVDHSSKQGPVVRNGVVVIHEWFQYISVTNMVAAILFTFFIDWYAVCTGTLCGWH